MSAFLRHLELDRLGTSAGGPRYPLHAQCFNQLTWTPRETLRVKQRQKLQTPQCTHCGRLCPPTSNPWPLERLLPVPCSISTTALTTVSDSPRMTTNESCLSTRVTISLQVESISEECLCFRKHSVALLRQAQLHVQAPPTRRIAT